MLFNGLDFDDQLWIAMWSEELLESGKEVIHGLLILILDLDCDDVCFHDLHPQQSRYLCVDDGLIGRIAEHNAHGEDDCHNDECLDEHLITS